MARKHKISYDSLWRHWRRHLTPEQKDRLRFGDAPAHKLKGMVAEEGISVLKDLNFARKSLIEALAAAPASAAHGRSVLAGRLHENARIRGTISGELASSPLVVNQTNNVFLQDPSFAQFQADLVRALAPHPAACDAVLEVFARLEAVPAELPALEHQSDEEATA